MPRRKGPRSELMIEAASRGGELAQRAAEEVVRERQEAAAQIERGITGAAQTFFEGGEREKDRQLRREETASELASRERVATAERAQQQSQYEEQRDIEMAHKGIVRKPDEQQQNGEKKLVGEGKGAFDPRAMKLQEEMQRGAAQMAQPVEQLPYGDNRFAPSPERMAAEQQKAGLAQQRSMLAEERVRTQRMNAVTAAQRAQIAGDKETYERERASLLAPLKSDQKLLDDLLSGKAESADPRWAQLRDQLKDHPSAEIRKEVEDRKVGEHLGRFLKNKVATQGLQFVSQLGDLPDDDLIDTSNPLWQQFVQETAVANQFMGESDVASWLDISSMQQKNRLVRRAAAMKMLVQMSRPQQAQRQAGAQNVVPQRIQRPAGPSVPEPPGQLR